MLRRLSTMRRGFPRRNVRVRGLPYTAVALGSSPEGRQASGTRGGPAVGWPRAPPAGMVPSPRAPHVGQLSVECGLRGSAESPPPPKEHQATTEKEHKRPRLWQACDTVDPVEVWVDRLST